MTTPAQFSTWVIRKECETLGLPVDELGLAQAQDMAAAHSLTQKQFDAALVMHARRVKFMFCPSNYDWKTRLSFVWHFLFNPKRW